MTTINGRACIVNGTPVDKVFSNGRQVYGRNLYTDTKNFDNLASWYASSHWIKTTDTYKGLAVMQTTPQNQNMNNWVWSDPAKKAASITYANGVNTIDYTGVPYYEVFNMPIHAKVGDKVSVTFGYTQPAVVSLHGDNNGVPVSFSNQPLEHSAIGDSPIYLGVNAQSNKVYTISTTATSETMYLSFNFGYLVDGIDWKFELSVGAWNGLSQYIQVKKGDVLTYSAYAKYVSGTGTSEIYWGLNQSTEGSYSAATINPGSNAVTITDSWHRISGTTVAASDGYLRPRLEQDASNTNTLQISGIKVEKCSVANPWSPAPEDILN